MSFLLFDDHLAIFGPDTVLDEIAHVDFAGAAWRKDLLRSKPPVNTTEGRIEAEPEKGV